jgi:hypothetical protein
MGNDGKIHRKKFNDVAHAVRYRKLWCANYATLKFDTVKKNLEQSLDVKVDTARKAEELFDNIVADAMRMSTVKSDVEFRAYLDQSRKSFERLNDGGPSDFFF